MPAGNLPVGSDHEFVVSEIAMEVQAKVESGVKISVLIPAYNAAAFLPRCLASVFAQTFQPTEVIVVDDGSTDDTAVVAEKLGARVIRRQNGGISAARNTGIMETTGEWIALLDADDLWAPEKLELQAACIRPETFFVYTGVQFFDDKGIREDQPAAAPSLVAAMLRYRNPISPSSVLVRRQTFLEAGGFMEGISACEDWELWFRLSRLGPFVAISAPLTSYYVYPGSLSANPEKMLQPLDLLMETTFLSDLKGMRRWAWRRRIRATQLCSAGLIARENGLSQELRYMFRSLCSWPSPFWEPRRFAMFAVSTRKKIR
jgi:glycosyltransferase involved in cell wall biosynthesis